MKSSASSLPKIDPNSGVLLSVQIANHYRQEIVNGTLSNGDHLPTCQRVGKMLGVAAQTVNNAFDILASEGLVLRRRSVGTIVNLGKTEPTLTRVRRSPRQNALPICHVARLSTIAWEESDLITDYLNGFTEGFEAWKYRFEIAYLRETQSDLELVKSLIEQKQVRGLVVLPLLPDAMEYLRSSGFPMVFLNKDGSSHGVTSVVADAVKGYHEAWAYVDRIGHRSAAFFGLDSNNFERRYRECTSGRELLQPLCQLAAPAKAPSDGSSEGIWAALTETYGPWNRKSRSRKWPTLFFAQTDIIATKLIRALRQYDVHVPRDVSVIGFNDASIAKHWDPPLTTLEKPRYQMGLAASRLLLELLSKRPAAQGALQTFPTRLVERSSCAPL